MKTIKFEQQNVVIAENQEEFESLPALIENGVCHCCFILDEVEREVLKTLPKERWDIAITQICGLYHPLATRTSMAFNKTQDGFFLNPNQYTEEPLIEGQDKHRAGVFVTALTDNEKDKLQEDDGKLWVSFLVATGSIFPFNCTVIEIKE